MTTLLLALLCACAPTVAHRVAALPPVAEVPDCDRPAEARTFGADEATPIATLRHLLSPGDARTGATVMEQGADALLTRAWLTESAARTIDLQYFIFAADNVGLVATDTLLRAAERGVRVRLLVDDTLAHGDAELLASLDVHPNLEVRVYNPGLNVGRSGVDAAAALVTDFRGVNQRMHNKVLLVDGEAAITGGRNVANAYFDFDRDFNFRDRDVLLLGGAVAQVQDSFDAFWAHPLATPIATAMRRAPDLAPEAVWTGLHRHGCDPKNVLPVFRTAIPREPDRLAARATTGALQWLDDVRYVSDAPGKNAEASSLSGSGLSTAALMDLVRGARTSVDIQTPYLVTTALGQRLFADTVARGVRVRILTNSLAATDNVAAFAGYRRGRETMLRAGVELYEYRPDARIRAKLLTSPRRVHRKASFGLHAKSMVVDGETLVVGTFNLDPRSANLNTEGIAILRSPELAGEVRALMEREMSPENAWRATLDDVPDNDATLLRRGQAWVSALVPTSLL